MERLDNYEELPEGMRKYLSTYGWHFSKKMYEWSVSKMMKKNNEYMTPITKEYLEIKLNNYGIKINYSGYDALYVYCMAYCDFYGSSITSESSLFKYIKDYIEDIDGYDTIAFNRFYADTIAKGIPIIWEDML